MARMNAYHIEAHFLIGIENFLKLVLAQEAIIDKNASQVPTNRFIEQDGSHGAIHASRKAKNDFVVAQLFFQTRHRVVDERVRGPVALAAANAEREVGQHLRAFFRVEHFGMELHRVGLLPFYLVGGVLHIVRRCNDSRARGQFGNRVAVAHPHLARLAHALEQRRLFIDHRQHGTAIFAGNGAIHFAAKTLRDELCAIANAEQRQLPFDVRQIGNGSLFVAHRERTSAENHAFNVLTDGRNLIKRMDFAIDIQLAEAATNELRHLRAKVENENHFLHKNKFCAKISFFHG